MYEWTCSPYDSANDKYYIPHFGETSEAFQWTWQSSSVGVSYIYPINSIDLNCTGLVTALEFCYTTTASIDDTSSRNAFNFILLNGPIRNRFEVTKTIQILATSFEATCRIANPLRCCEIMEFNLQDQFNITSPDLAIGFDTRQDSNINHQGLHTSSYPMYSGLSYAASSSLSLGSTVSSRHPIEQSLRLAWLHIGE